MGIYITPFAIVYSCPRATPRTRFICAFFTNIILRGIPPIAPPKTLSSFVASEFYAAFANTSIIIIINFFVINWTSFALVNIRPKTRSTSIIIAFLANSIVIRVFPAGALLSWIISGISGIFIIIIWKRVRI